MSDLKALLERADRAVSDVPLPPDGLDGLHRRRDRKRRNQRIAAGVVGIAVFVTAVWMVTSGLSLDRYETAVVPGEHVTGPVETGPPYGEPDVVRRGECHPPIAGPLGGGGLELWDLWDPGDQVPEDLGDQVRVRFHLLSMSEGGWRVVLSRTHIPLSPPDVVFRGTRVPGHNIPGHFNIIRYVTDLMGVDVFQAKAVNKQTGQVCTVVARIE